MNKTTEVFLHFRKNNKETSDFSEIFFKDLKNCLMRFKMDITAGKEAQDHSSGFHVIFITMTDLEDQKFIKEVLEFSEKTNALLVNIDPFKSIEKGFPIHKFKIFRFWDEIKETGEIRLFRGNEAGNNALYWEKITDVAIELVELSGTSGETKKSKIFLAQTDIAQSGDRDNLFRDLVEMGYDVVPDRLFSMEYNECTQQIKRSLEGCSLIIHPIPMVYSKHFSDKQISLVELQCDLSSEFAASRQKDVKRIIWIPSDFEITDEENQIFVEKIQRDQDQLSNSLVLKVTLEDLKKIYTKILSGEDVSKVEYDLPDVYFVADNDDDQSGEKILKSNTTKGISVNRNFKGITYNQHLQYLANSQFVVINYTDENEQWFTMKVNDIFKSKGISPSKPFKKLILVKKRKDLKTESFEKNFTEVLVGSLDDLKLDLTFKNN